MRAHVDSAIHANGWPVGQKKLLRPVATGDMEIASRIASYELAFRMQMAAPELMDLSKESPATLEMYGVNEETTKQFGTNCLLARRMVERGVRFVMLMHGSWDQHTNLLKNLKKNCDNVDQPTAALLKDLKQRGLLASTTPWRGLVRKIRWRPVCSNSNTTVA